MANVYRSNTVSIPSAGGAAVEEVKYAIADTVNAAFVAIDEQFTSDGDAVSQISTPELVGAQYAVSGTPLLVLAMNVNVIVSGNTQTTSTLRIVTADTAKAAFDAAEAQVITDGDETQGIELATKDPIDNTVLETVGIAAAVFASAGGEE